MVLEPLASGEAVLHDDEKELGVALIDIGGGTTDMAIFTDGSIVHTSVLAVGGHQLTARHRLRPALAARGGRAHQAPARLRDGLDGRRGRDDGRAVGGRTPGARRSSASRCARVIQPRVEEIFMLVRREIEKDEYEDKLASGAVITGGSTILEGMPELAEEVLGMPVRRGSPMGVGGLVDVVRTPMLLDRRGPRAIRR